VAHPHHHHPAPATGSHPSGRAAKARRPFGDPVAYEKGHPVFIPPPFTNRVNLNLPLQAVMADDWIQKAGKIVFHALGDTGGIHGTDVEEAVAHQMEAQVEAAAEAEKPAFFYHLGDVIYFNGQSDFYRPQFYEPFQYYQPFIFAIPGNHDGDTHVRAHDPPVTEPSLTGFMTNFCDEQPRHLFPYRETMTQPYVYWTLEAPFVTLIGLYSNVDGSLDGRGSFEQQRWLQQQLADAPKDKCLLLAVHHPPYSLDRPHGGSPDILKALDGAIQTSGRVPDAVLSAHVHSYQRFTRRRAKHETPFLVAGAGGYANTPKAMHKLQVNPADGSPITTPFQTTEAEVTLESFNDTDPGFLRVTIDAQTLTAEYLLIPFDGEPPTDPYDTFSLNWRTHKLG
jgi:hypothetical protein